MSVNHHVAADRLGAQALGACRSVLRLLAVAVAAPFATFVRQLRINRTAVQLEALDDRTLADIGLRRTHILSTATQVVDWPHVDPRRLSR